MAPEINLIIKNKEDVQYIHNFVDSFAGNYQRKILSFLVNEFILFNYDKVYIRIDIIGDFDFHIFYNNESIIWISVGSKTQVLSVYGVEFRWDEELSDIELQEELYFIYTDIFRGKYKGELEEDTKGNFISSTITYKNGKGLSSDMITSLLTKRSERNTKEFNGVNLYK